VRRSCSAALGAQDGGAAGRARGRAGAAQAFPVGRCDGVTSDAGRRVSAGPRIFADCRSGA